MTTWNKFKQVLLAENGTVEVPNNRTKYGKWYGLDGNPWCAMFVSWCAWKAGIPTSVIPKHAWTPSGDQWFKKRGRYHRVGKTTANIKPGDICYFSNGRRVSHIGVVLKVLDKYTVLTIEGNTGGGNRVNPNGGQVMKKRRRASQIYSVGHPDYASVKVEPKKLGVDVIERGDTGAVVVTLQKMVGFTKKEDLDGIFGGNTEKAVRALQTKLKVTVDGKWGPESQRAYTASLPKAQPVQPPQKPSTPPQNDAGAKPSPEPTEGDYVLPEGIQGALWDALRPKELKSEEAVVYALQEYLVKYGFGHIERDGKMGRQTTRALQQRLSVPVTGVLDEKTLDKLASKLGRGTF